MRQVSQDTGLPVSRLQAIVHERRSISAETAIALGEYFGQTPEFWMNAQRTHDLSKVLVERGSAIRSRVHRLELDHLIAD